MNDDITLMPPPPPRRLKRHKTLPSLNIERTALVVQEQEQQPSASAPIHHDSAMISNSEGNLGYSLTDGVRPGAVSPEDCASASMEFGASPSIHCVKPCDPEATHNSILTIESSIHSEIQNKGNSYKSYEDCLADNRTAGNGDILKNRNHQSSRNTPIESSGKTKLNQKVSDIESTRENYQHGSMKRRQSQIRDSHTLVNVSFRDIIGHGQAKLRLDEALLPLALPSDLADSVLTGAFIQSQLS